MRAALLFLFLGACVAAVFACGAAISADATDHSGPSVKACPPDIAQTGASCAAVAPKLYEFTFLDGRKAWCEDAGSQAWCSVPVAASVGPKSPAGSGVPAAGAKALP